MGLLIYTFMFVLVMISIWSRAEHTSLIPRSHFDFSPVYLLLVTGVSGLSVCPYGSLRILFISFSGYVYGLWVI
jgi:hypothetical protein